MTAPPLSVLVPVYNAAPHLDAALAGIAGQDFGDWELVAVDDASTDESAEILRRWADRDVRIRVVRNATNAGQTVSLNRGLAQCRGRWVARQDADDISHRERLGAQMRYLAHHPQTALLGAQGVLIDERGAKIGLLAVPEDAESVAWCAPFLNPFLHTAVMFRREVALRAGGYDEDFRIAQDYELWTRLASGHASANLPDSLVSYRHSETSLSKTERTLAFAEADRVSGREAARWLGRAWTREEAGLVSAFRSGSASVCKRDFWSLIADLEKAKASSLPSKLRAGWHLRLAGVGGGVDAAEVAAAFRAAPGYTARWLYRRFLSS